MADVHLNKHTTACELTVKNYKDIFSIISEEYDKYCTQWVSGKSKTFNLKKNCICDVYKIDNVIERDFKEYMNDFIRGLDSLYLNINFRISVECGMSIRGRVKAPESILSKIDKKNNQQKGSFQIIKCLNDLLGLRIIDLNYKDNIENVMICLEASDYKVRHMERIKEDYIGYHVYFKQNDNIYFPIELQIWDAENEHNNINSHKMYKQDYLEWTTNYNKIKKRGE